MTKKTLKLAAVVIVLLLAAVTGTAVTARTPAELPEYVGSQACLGCHADQSVAWQESLHHESFQVIDNPAAYPGDVSAAAPELQAELKQADYVWRGKRFVAQDPVTGDLKYLNVQWNTETLAYETYKGGSIWSDSCGGCHSGAVNSGIHKEMTEPGISCESCHGPGRDHILGKGDRSKIVTSTLPSETCAQCHSGMNTIKGQPRNAVGYKPGTPIEDYAATFLPNSYVNGQVPPQKDDHHLEEYPQWKASGHANATNLLIEHGPAYPQRQECIYCHSTAAGIQIKEKGLPFNAETDLVNDGVSCVACHDSHNSEFTAQLKMEPQALCVSCHSVGRGNPAPQTIGTVRAPHSPQADMLWGQAAIGIAPTKGVHSELTCVSCHMTEGNHMMSVIKPADVAGTERVDSCTKCHTDSTADSRGVYLELWNESINNRLAVIAADVATIDARLKANANALTGDDLKLYQNTRANFWYVQKDKSGGAHNFEYAIKILSQVQKDMAKIKTILK